MKYKYLNILAIFILSVFMNKYMVFGASNADLDLNVYLENEKKVNQMIEKFTKHNEQDFKVEGFSLNIYKKDGFPFLEYVHDKTKARIMFVLANTNYDKNSFTKDKYLFRAFSANDYGLVNFLKSCLFQDLKMDFNRFYKKDPKSYFDVWLYDVKGLEIIISPIENDQQFMENMFQKIKSPVAFQKPEFFEVVKRAVINEVSNLGNKTKKDDFGRSTYPILGFADEIEKITMNDVKKFYDDYIHPSNFFVTKTISDFNPNEMKQFLKLIEKEYLNDYSYKKIEVKYPLRDENRYWIQTKEISKDNSNELYGNKYTADVRFDFKKLQLNAKQKDALVLLSLDESFEKELENFIVSLGYKKKSRFIPDNINESLIVLRSDNLSLVTEQALLENSKKIITYIKDKLCSLNDHDLKQEYLFLKDDESNKYAEYKLKDPYMYRNNRIDYRFSHSLQDYGEFFSNMNFDINQNNEIINTKDSIFKNVKENLNVLDILINNGPSYIDVFQNF